MPPVRSIALLLAIGMTVAACGSAAVPVTSTIAPTTTTTPATTTTTSPPLLLSVDGAPATLAEPIEELYAWLADRTLGIPAGLPAGLVETLEGTEPITGEVVGEVTTGDVLGSKVAVFRAGEDVVLAVADEPDRWRVVGAHLARTGAPAWFGASPRLVLIIGSDARPGQDPLGYRADSLHVVTSVPYLEQGAIVGIPRDAWVETSYGGSNKFTNVMAARGPEVVLETARRVTGLPLEGYLVTGFAGFGDLIDALGGFSFDVPFAMAEPKSQAYFRAGLQLFSGADALAFARNRTISGGDLTRSYHQGLLMLAALRKVLDLGVSELPRLLAMLTEFTWTDLSAEDLLTLAAGTYLLDPDTLPNVVVDGRVGTAGSASVVYLADAAFATFEDLTDGLLDD